MPGSKFFGDVLKSDVKTGKVSEETINQSVFRILVSMFKFGTFDVVNNNTKSNNVTTENSVKMCKEIAQDHQEMLG